MRNAVPQRSDVYGHPAARRRPSLVVDPEPQHFDGSFLREHPITQPVLMLMRRKQAPVRSVYAAMVPSGASSKKSRVRQVQRGNDLVMALGREFDDHRSKRFRGQSRPVGASPSQTVPSSIVNTGVRLAMASPCFAVAAPRTSRPEFPYRRENRRARFRQCPADPPPRRCCPPPRRPAPAAPRHRAGTCRS